MWGWGLWTDRVFSLSPGLAQRTPINNNNDLSTQYPAQSALKAGLLSVHFDSKQSRESVDQPLTCHPSPSFTTFVFRSSEVRRLLLDLDPYGDTDPLGLFPLFLKRTADVMALCLSVVFGGLFVLVVSRLAGDRPMSLQFRKVHRPLLLPITNQFP